VIILDTNAISEMMRPAPDQAVLERMKRDFASSPPYTTAITQAEILYGIGLLPAGRRRKNLEKLADGIFGEDFAGRILPFDSEAAVEYAALAVAARKAGRRMSEADGRIASIARLNHAALMTRNVRDFEGCGIKLKNPWRE